MQSERDPEQHLQGVAYPANRDELLSAAKNNNAPQDFIETLEGLDKGQFANQSEVMTEVVLEEQGERTEF